MTDSYEDVGYTEPVSLEMERGVIGAMLFDSSVCGSIFSVLDERDFFRPAHRMMYRAIHGLVEGGHPVDFVTLSSRMESEGTLHLSGGVDYLRQIEDEVFSAANSAYYATVVKDKSVRRQMLASAREQMARAMDLTIPVLDHWSTSPSVFKLYDDSELESLPALEWLIKNFIPRKGLGMIYGPPGNGKTFVVLDLCCAVAKGNFLFAKEFGIEGPYRVCYCAGEKFHGIPARKKATQTKWGLNAEEAGRFKVCRGVPQLFDRNHPGSAARFIDYMRPMYPDGLELLIVDTLHLATLGANEINGSDVGAEIEATKEIQEALGCAVIPVHHSGAANTRERGHTGWKASVDLMIKVQKAEGSKDKLEVTIEKISEADDNFVLNCEIVAVEGCISRAIEWEGRGTPLAKDLKADVLRILKSSQGMGLSKQEVFDRVLLEGTKISAVYAALNRLAEHGKSKTGVERVPLIPEGKSDCRPGTTKNPYLFRFNDAWIEQSSHASYRDSDDAEEIPPIQDDPLAAEVEAYDPFADE